MTKRGVGEALIKVMGLYLLLTNGYSLVMFLIFLVLKREAGGFATSLFTGALFQVIVGGVLITFGRELAKLMLSEN